MTPRLPLLAASLLLMNACIPEVPPGSPGEPGSDAVGAAYGEGPVSVTTDGVTLEVDAAAPDATHPDGWFCRGEAQARYATAIEEDGGLNGLDLLLCLPGAAVDFGVDAACEQPAGDLAVSVYLWGAFPVGEGDVPADGETFERRGLSLDFEHADSGNHDTVLQVAEPYVGATLNLVSETEGSIVWTDLEWDCPLGGAGGASAAEVVLAWHLDPEAPVAITPYTDEP